MVAGRRILRISLELYVAGNHPVGDNFHTLFPFVGSITFFACLILVIIKDDNFSEGILDLIALFTCLVSPFFELRKRYVLDLLTRFHPGAGLEHFIIVRVGVTDVSDYGKLNSTSQRELLCISYSVGALFHVSIYATYHMEGYCLPLRRHD